MNKEETLFDRQTGLAFDKRQTNIAKGIAVLLLLWHHLFYNDPEHYDRFTSLYIFRGVPIECWLADFCKVCVAVFLFLSGYGLYKSWEKYQGSIIRGGNYKLGIKQRLLFVKNHLLKLMFNYWFIFLLFVPFGIFFGKKFWEIYNGNVLYGIIDIMGFANLFNTPTMNATWWFMSLIIILYLLFPLIVKGMEWSAETIVVFSFVFMMFPYIASFVPYIGQYSIWFPPFIMGMYFAERNGMEFLQKHNPSIIKGVFLSVFSIALFAFLRLIIKHYLAFDTFFALSIILFCYLILSRVPVLNTVIEHLGKHSGAIFMFHTFIFDLYFKDFIYWFKYPPIIFIVLTVICYFIAVGMEYLKKLIRYDKLVISLTK